MDNSSESALGFQFGPERFSSRATTEMMKIKLNRKKVCIISRVSQAVEEWCKSGKCETMLTEKQC